jgi:hypothetical protein
MPATIAATVGAFTSIPGSNALNCTGRYLLIEQNPQESHTVLPNRATLKKSSLTFSTLADTALSGPDARVKFFFGKQGCRNPPPFFVLIPRLKLAAVSVNSALRIKDMSLLFGNVYSVEH